MEKVFFFFFYYFGLSHAIFNINSNGKKGV